MPPSPCDDDDDTASTTSELSNIDYNIDYVAVTPIIACHGVMSQVKSIIRHVQTLSITIPPKPTVTVSSHVVSSDKSYSEPRSMRIPDDYIIKHDNSSPITEADWKLL